ncbi:acyltransferase [Acinetobacter sp. ANC 4910]|uniref:acyltransferase family protein n=1 Tax=Acinetobacter sp. ANC 4910 TaxID=2529850 RepID=UPI00103DC096|nr:acyltransferase [Acinetobacter sp. ANC 4910]TCB34909.1 acyltransferase [Acinetobacter sp. ANC 4910]
MQFFPIDALYLFLILILCIGLAAVLLNKVQFLPTEIIQRSSPLDGLRGILALSVLAHHFYITYVWKTVGEWVKPEFTLINNFGGTAVSLFFLITGYLFINKMMQVDINWKQLYLSRIKRIYPLYIAAFVFILTITLIIIEINSANFGALLKWVSDWLLFKGGSFEGFESGLIIAGVSWTLAYEWKFYFSLPIIYCIYHKKIPLALSLVIIAALLFYIFKEKSHYYYALFILSIPAIKLKHQFKRFMIESPKKTNVIVITLSLFSLLFTEPYTFLQMIPLAIIFGFIANGYNFFGVLYNHGLRILGEVSYSIYLIHGAILYFFFSILNLINFNNISLYSYYLLFPIIFSVVVLLSLFTYKFIESPFLRKKSTPSKVDHGLVTNK